MALSVGVERINVFRDSSIVICQNQGKWRTRDDKLKTYQEHLEQMVKYFKEISFEYLPRDSLRFVDTLATLASMVECSPKAKIHPFLVDRRTRPAYGEPINLLTVDGRAWITYYIRGLMMAYNCYAWMKIKPKPPWKKSSKESVGLI
ncbi:uncharacterized protein LOC122650723 [Telopea speciosissima]|uniref:uncharacterized protein LOC122650723 n=1 Tax=Telopea speciosissima TaxID=54955 RepID=UPI001CC33CE0|nr:uncharacterized protein LOC122650723 [Telopea speciosissima]